MLMPSALPCDVRPPLPPSRISSSRLFTTPPPSDDDVASQPNTGIYNTCRALQTLLGTQRPAQAPSAKPEPLLSPITMAPRMKVTKKSSKPKATPKLAPRGFNKRRRDITDDGRAPLGPNEEGELKFSTPKRMRLAPPELPLGISSEDFQALVSPTNDTSMEHAMAEDKDNDWSAEDDRKLVELVLEKLKLTKDDWNECALKLGKESESLGKRWKELVGEGHVGLRRGRRVSRMKLDSIWR